MDINIDISSDDSSRGVIEYDDINANHSFIFVDIGLTLIVNHEQMEDLYKQIKPWIDGE